MKTMLKSRLAILLIWMIASCEYHVEKKLDLSKATILISPTIKPPVHETVGNILMEEIGKRTSSHLSLSENWNNKTIIALALTEDKNLFGEEIPHRIGDDLAELKKEGYRIFHENKNGKDILWITGADTRGVLYGIGKLLRTADMQEHQITIAGKMDISTSPEYALRGHQFGYRNTANSWDSWKIRYPSFFISAKSSPIL